MVSIRPRALPSVIASLLAAVFLLCARVGAGPHTKTSFSLSTQERVQSPGWWPTKGTAARSDFVGTAQCAQCHEQIAATQQTTPMAHASAHANDSEVLHSHAHLSAQRTDFRYDLSTTTNAANFSVSQGPDSISATLLWAFGVGHKGQTYIYQRDTGFYESHLSFYKSLQALDLTTGHDPNPPDDLKSAMGRWLAPAEAQRCFGCHTTRSTISSHFDTSTLTPGVTCEACHGPGAHHVAAMKAGNIEAGRHAIFNPRHLDAAASVDFCGACHRSWSDVMLGEAAGVITARFQPYRLESSKCWRKGDARLTCVACHNPHENLVEDLGSYDEKCLSCHQTTKPHAPSAELSETDFPHQAFGDGKSTKHDHAAPACPVSTQNCVTCHMPKIEVPTIHAPFTDHNIRIVRPNQPFPD